MGLAIQASRGLVGPAHHCCVDVALELGLQLLVPRAPAHGLVLMHSLVREDTRDANTASPYQHLARVWDDAQVVASMRDYFASHVRPAIEAGYRGQNTESDPWGQFEVEMGEAADKTDWMQLAALWHQLEPEVCARREERASRRKA